MPSMQTNEHDESGQRVAGETEPCGTLVVLTKDLGPIARTKLWLVEQAEGYRLLVVPRLHVEQHAALLLLSGRSPAKLFEGCELITPHWSEKIVGYVGGQWMLYKTSRSEFSGVGFVLGNSEFNIERAVRGVSRLLT
jgi:hypothetical protein